MSLSEIVNAMRQQAMAKKAEERMRLQCIAQITDNETAAAAAELYAPEKHAYSFEGYLYQLAKLESVLRANVPSKIALEAVDHCLETEQIIAYYAVPHNVSKLGSNKGTKWLRHPRNT